FSSTASLDIIKSFFPTMSAKTAVKVGRISTIIFGIAAMLLAFKAPSILMLLLFADLVAAAAVVPVIAGLFHSKITGNLATIGTILGIVLGLPLFFMNESLYSFVVAIVASSLVVFIGGSFSKQTFDF